ncbi:hypothetical protein L249_4477, partial [Ophiocordyceps polyrhachis-furcata BCC 54312]
YRYFSGSARHSYTHTQGTRPEGLGGSRDAGPAAAGPRPPYVTEAVRGGYGTATPYSGYGRTGRTGRTRPEGLGGSRDAGPAAAGPRPPYVTEARLYVTTIGRNVTEVGTAQQRRRRLRHGYAVQRLRPYGPYGPYKGRNV